MMHSNKIHLGKNPSIGGIPPSDIKLKKKSRFVNEDLLFITSDAECIFCFFIKFIRVIDSSE